MSDALSLVKQFYLLLGAGNAPAALELLDPEVEWTEAENTPYFYGTMHGVDAVVSGLFEPLTRDFNDFKTIPHSFLTEGDKVVSFGNYSGVAKATGRAMAAPFVHMWTAERGHLRTFKQYTDSKAWSDALEGGLHEQAKLERNKQTILAFYKKALFEGDVDTAARLYGGSSYTQHTPFAANGFDGLREYVKWIASNYPSTHGEIKRVFADGDFVILHCHWLGFFGKNGDAIIDLFRLENGKVVEHWDVIQAIPDSSLNQNSMF